MISDKGCSLRALSSGVCFNLNTIHWVAWKCRPLIKTIRVPNMPSKTMYCIETIRWCAFLQWANDLCLTCMSGRPLTHFYEVWWFKGNCTTTFSHLDHRCIRRSLSHVCVLLSHRVINKSFHDNSNSFNQLQGKKHTAVTHSVRPTSSQPDRSSVSLYPYSASLRQGLNSAVTAGPDRLGNRTSN